jgi:hypothetical protein
MGGFRRFTIRTVDVLMIVIVIGSTIMLAVSGASWGGMAGGGAFAVILGFILGAAIGFVSSAVVAAAFFLLLEIAENSRRTVAFFDRMDAARQQR